MKKTGLLAILAVFFLLLGLVDTMPVGRYFSRGIPFTRHADSTHPVVTNMAGDHLQLYYRFWLFQDVLKGHSRLFENKYEFHTGKGESFPVYLYFFPYPLIFSAFSFLGRGAGFNAALLASYLLSGLGMYLLVHYYTKDRLAALCAGAIFAVAPYRTTSIMGGHPAGFSMFLVPLFFFALEKILADKTVRSALLGALTFWCLTDNDLHVIYLSLLVAPLFVVKHFVATGRKEALREVKKLIVPSAVFLVVAVLPLFRPSSILSSGAKTRRLSEVLSYSPDLSDAFLRHNAEPATAAYLGGVALLFAVAVFVLRLLRRRRTPEERRELWRMGFFLALLAGAYILVFGPKFPFSKPYLFLFHHLPKFTHVRQTAKLMILSSFALAVAAGLGLACLRRILPAKRGAAVLLGFLVLSLFDQLPFFAAGPGISILPGEAKAYEAAFQGRPGAKVINVPLWPGNDAWSSHYEYYTTIYRTIMVNGYSPATPSWYSREFFKPLVSLNAGQISRAQHDLLRRMGIEYLILHEESFPPKVSLFPSQYTLENLFSSPYLEVVSSEPPISVFRILDTPGPVNPSKIPPSSVSGVVHRGADLGGGEVIRDDSTAAGKVLWLGKETGSRTVVPRRTTPAGEYTLSMRVKTDGAAECSLSVLISDGEKLVASESFSLDTLGAYQTLSTGFSLPEATAIITRLDKPPGSALALEWIYLTFTAEKDPLGFFEFEEIYHIGNVKLNPGASGGKAVFLTAADPVGPATRGPYRLYGKGAYTLTLSLAHEDPGGATKEGEVTRVSLRSDLDPGEQAGTGARDVIMAPRGIRSSDFPVPEAFTPFTYPFTLERPTFLSIDVAHLGRDLYLDTVTIEKVNR